MYGLIGLGQAGSNVAAEAQKTGVKAGAINYSEKDLLSVDVNYKLQLNGSEGVGKRRKLAVDLLLPQWNNIISFIRNNFLEQELLVFSFSLGGGSGSGLAPATIDMVRNEFENKTIVAHAILPSKDESFISQKNALDTINELMEIGVSVFITDNEYYTKQNQDFTRKALLNKTNKDFIYKLNKLISYTNKHSSTGNFDFRDLLTVLNEGGLMKLNVNHIYRNVSNLKHDKDSIKKKVGISWKTEDFSINNFNQVNKIVSIVDNINDENNTFKLNELLKDYNINKKEVFEGYYHEDEFTITTLLTNLSWNQSRFTDIQKSLKTFEYQEEQIKTFETGIEKVVNFNQPKKKVAALDLLRKYQN